MEKEKETRLYYCDGKRKCKSKVLGCYKYGGECRLTTDKKHAIPGPDTFEVEIREN